MLRKVIYSSEKEYCSPSYIFTDIKESDSLITHVKTYPDSTNALMEIILDEEQIQDAIDEYSEDHLYSYLQKSISDLHKGAVNWKSSEKDLEGCKMLIDYGDKINVAEKLQDGLKSAILKNKWSFNQIIYQALAALKTYDENYTL